MRIKDLPPGERPRERLWAVGARSLSDRELVALLLGSARSGESALDLAGRLVAERSGLAGLATAHPEELALLSGVGRARAASLVAAFELARRLARARTGDSQTIRRPADLSPILLGHLGGLRRERVVVVVLNRGNRVTRIEPITEGSIDRSLLPIREILNVVLRHDGVAFALGHNHPSGDPTPSVHDIDSTRQLAQAAPLVGLRFVDHLILADGRWVSLRDGGHLT